MSYRVHMFLGAAYDTDAEIINHLDLALDSRDLDAILRNVAKTVRVADRSTDVVEALDLARARIS